jgi:hypothetical protein
MVVAHVLAAVACTVLICAAERLCAAVAGELRRLVVVALEIVDGPDVFAPAAPSVADLVLRILVRSGSGTRAPPARVALA